MLPENLNIPPPRPKRKPAHPYPRKAEPQTSEQLLPAQSGSGSLPTLAAAAAAASPSQQQQQAAGAAQARGVSPGPRHAAGSEAGGVSRPSPFSAVQQQVHSRRQLPGASSGGSAGADRQQHGQAEGGGHAAAVAAVAAAASAAAAAAAAAVVAAAEAHVQASLQANPPKGFPFFGLPPSILANMGLQGQASGAIGSLSLAPSLLLSPAPSAGGIHPAQHIPDSSALQGLSQGFAQTAQLPLNVAALSTLARLACSGGLAGLTAAVGGGAVTTCPEAQQAVAVHAVASDGHTATNVPGARNPAAVQAADDASDGLRRDSGKRRLERRRLGVQPRARHGLQDAAGGCCSTERRDQRGRCGRQRGGRNRSIRGVPPCPGTGRCEQRRSAGRLGGSCRGPADRGAVDRGGWRRVERRKRRHGDAGTVRAPAGQQWPPSGGGMDRLRHFAAECR